MLLDGALAAALAAPARTVTVVWGADPRVAGAAQAFAEAVGAAARLRLRLPARSFARWDEWAGGWVWPAGRFQVHAGRSARDLRLTGEVRSG